MTETKTEPKKLLSWTFEGEGNEPSQQQIMELLKSRPLVYGAKVEDYADFVQALPSNRTVDAGPDPRHPKARLKNRIPTWTVYFTVPGRVAMLNDICDAHDWTMVEEYEPITQSGIPGLLFAEKIVTRLYIEIFDMDGRSLGRRVGTAWVPAPGDRKNAAASNPYEKAETAARGRAIAAWGIGVLPGSGIASLEEVQEARRAQEGPTDGPGIVESQDAGRPDPEQQRAQIIEWGIQLAQIANLTQDGAEERTRQYLTARLQSPELWLEEEHRIDWDRMSPGKLHIMWSDYRAHINRARFDQQGGQS